MNQYPLYDGIAFKRSYGVRLLMLFLLALAGLFVAAIVLAVVHQFSLNPTASLRLTAIIQDMFLFILPPVAVAVMVCNLPARLLCVDRGIPARAFIIGVAVLIVSTPAMNALIDWNEHIELPASLAGIEEWMRQAEDAAKGSINIMLGEHTVANLVMKILVVGILAGFSEEVFFLGGLQRLIASNGLNIHAAIWISAFVFSFFHMQFYGFFPRLLLGAFFGYMLYATGSLWLPVILHALNNTIYVVSVYVSGSEKAESTADSFGVGDPVLIMASVILTACLFYYLFKKPSQTPTSC